jgi:hypothetical protein
MLRHCVMQDALRNLPNQRLYVSHGKHQTHPDRQ